MDPMNDLTGILNGPQGSSTRTTEEWVEPIYRELRRLATARMAGEAGGQTLQATALVHEAYLRLMRDGHRQWNSRGHFFGAAAEAMRRILVENARRKLARKRGAGAEKVPLDDVEIAAGSDEERILMVSDALERLEREDEQAAQLVKLRFFVGLSGEETAAALGLPVRTATRLWAFARAWLYRELRDPS
jgi:RNA polymerase sigma factor (TIGR02999 family)